MQYWELTKSRQNFAEKAKLGDSHAKYMLFLWDKDKQAYIKALKAVSTYGNKRSQVV